MHKMICGQCQSLVPTSEIRYHIRICNTLPHYQQTTHTLDMMRDAIMYTKYVNDAVAGAAKKQERYFLQEPSIRTGRLMLGHWTAPGLENPEQETQNQPKKFSPRRIGEWVSNRLKRND